jgi:GntR family transcriptional repressor for pyruvate dehydrogenase complex
MTGGQRAAAWNTPSRISLGEQATQQILDQLRNGVFRPGDRLPSQRELATAMGVGIAAIREALQRLEVLNIVEVRQGQNTVVVKPVNHELLLFDPELFLVTAEKELLLHVLEAREALETVIVTLAAQRATAADVESIHQALIQEMAEDHADYETHRRLNNQFHLAVAAATGNPVLVKMLSSLLPTWMILKTIFDGAMSARALELHRAIYEAIRDHDVVAASDAMQAHGDYSMEIRRQIVGSATDVS